jgi:hypothetical protein
MGRWLERSFVGAAGAGLELKPVLLEVEVSPLPVLKLGVPEGIEVRPPVG